MTAERQSRMRRVGRGAGLVGSVALAGWVALAWFAPGAAWPAYRFAAFACLQPALGCLIFMLIYRITGGQWGASLEPVMAAGIRLLPWIWPLIVLLLFVPAARPFASAAFPSGAALLIRACVYEAIFLGLRQIAIGRWGRSLAAPGLIVLVFTLHFLAADWFFTLEPGWYSSGFPLVWMSIQAASGLSLAIVAAAACGHNPDERGSAGRPLGQDWGDLILTTVIFSSYVAFVQFLIIWSGNLPREIAWYLRRGHGGWGLVILAVALFHLAFPAAFMLFRRLKHSRGGVPRVAALVFVADLIWAAWIILPAFPGRGFFFPVACVCGLIAGAGLFANRYVGAALNEEKIA